MSRFFFRCFWTWIMRRRGSSWFSSHCNVAYFNKHPVYTQKIAHEHKQLVFILFGLAKKRRTISQLQTAWIHFHSRLSLSRNTTKWEFEENKVHEKIRKTLECTRHWHNSHDLLTSCEPLKMLRLSPSVYFMMMITSMRSHASDVIRMILQVLIRIFPRNILAIFVIDFPCSGWRLMSDIFDSFIQDQFFLFCFLLSSFSLSLLPSQQHNTLLSIVCELFSSRRACNEIKIKKKHNINSILIRCCSTLLKFTCANTGGIFAAWKVWAGRNHCFARGLQPTTQKRWHLENNYES